MADDFKQTKTLAALESQQKQYEMIGKSPFASLGGRKAKKTADFSTKSLKSSSKIQQQSQKVLNPDIGAQS